MKGILEFDLTDLYERKSHQMATKGTEAYLALSDIRDLLRRQRKYGIEGKPSGVEDYLESLIEEIDSILEDREINLNDLL